MRARNQLEKGPQKQPPDEYQRCDCHCSLKEGARKVSDHRAATAGAYNRDKHQDRDHSEILSQQDGKTGTTDAGGEASLIR